MTSFTIPLDPMALPRHRHTRTGRTYERQDAKDYKRAVGMIARPHFPELMTGPLELSLTFVFARPKGRRLKNPKRATLAGLFRYFFPAVKPDIDNLAKMIMDSLNQVAWTDDALVTDLVVRKRYTNAQEGAILVELENMTLEKLAGDMTGQDPDDFFDLSMGLQQEGRPSPCPEN